MGARATRLAWRDIALEPVSTPRGDLRLTLGVGSGLSRGAGRLLAVTDRGPNLFISHALELGLTHLTPLQSLAGAKVMPTLQAGPEIVELHLAGGVLTAGRRMALRTRTGERLSGTAPSGPGMEALFELDGSPLPPNPLGADPEAIAVLPDGGVFIAEEYVPSLLKADADGVVLERWVPAGCEDAVRQPEVVVRGVLPEALGRRRANRGLEALCASPDGRWLYLGVQSALEGEDAGFAPIWKLEVATGRCEATFRYAFDAPESFRRDAARRAVTGADLKVCEFVWLGEDRLLVLERIAHTTKLYAVELVRGRKTLVLSSDDVPEIGPDMEGMTLISDREILLMSDNDFGVEGAATEAWLIALDVPI